ncbi:MAG TPA: sigma-70 family RNA polymerase sigma factor [Flavobacteriaceae bacterium]|nr:sigma-70 family RNA polymerase sigma factor [Flavobacteriaceae bacterium]
MQPDELILQLQNKNPQAFERIYELYSKSTFGIIFAIVQNKETAEEILQDVFLKIWENAESYSSEKGRFFTWILNIARNTAIDKLRNKEYRIYSQNQSMCFYVNVIEEKRGNVENGDYIGLKKCIETLKPFCKKLIDLLFFQGFTQKEASETLKTPLGTIKTRNRKCLKGLRDKLSVS